MTRTVPFFVSTLLLFGSVLCLAQATPVSAQEAGIEISPSLIEETLDPGSEYTYQLEVKNLNSNEQEYYLFTRNIESVGEGGVPRFADEWEPTGYELAEWVTLPTNAITIPAGATEVVPFTLSVPDNASPGSHFGGVFVSADPPEMENSGAAVGYQVANILSIRVSGDVVESASIRQFSTDRFLYGSQDVMFNVRIENDGNVLVRPAGPLEIFNALGKRVGQVTFNDAQAGVFPQDTREFADIHWLGDGAGFGRYEAVLSPVYGADGERRTMSSTVTFWVLPFAIIGPALGVLAVLLLVTFVGVKLYVRRALAQATAGRRLVRRRPQAGPSNTLLLLVSMLIVLALFMLVMLVLFA